QLDTSFRAAVDRQVPVLVEAPDAARPEPAVDERLGGLRRSAEVAGRHPRAADEELTASVARRGRGLDAPFEAGQRMTRGSVTDGRGIVEVTARRGGDLGHSVEVEDAHAHTVELLDQTRRR